MWENMRFFERLLTKFKNNNSFTLYSGHEFHSRCFSRYCCDGQKTLFPSRWWDINHTTAMLDTEVSTTSSPAVTVSTPTCTTLSHRTSTLSMNTSCQPPFPLNLRSTTGRSAIVTWASGVLGADAVWAVVADTNTELATLRLELME